MIKLHNLSIDYGNDPVVKDINLEIAAGEWVLITGPSGCGKSTLAYALGGMIPQSIPARVKGHVEVTGLNTQTNAMRDIVQQAGIVLQNPSSQLFHLKVEDEIAFGPRNLGLEDKDVSQRVDWALKATGLETLRDCKPSELSGGQKQCLAIASILAIRPRILILDEPTASLDVPSTRKVLDTLRSLNDVHGVTIVIIEHRLADVSRMASRLIFMNNGRIVADGHPDVILSDQCLRNDLGLRRQTHEPMAAWEALITSTKLHPIDQEPLLTLDNISAGYNRKKTIQDVNLKIFPRDFVALVGNNGAGKSTLGLVAAGLLRPLVGQVRFQNGDKPKPGLDVAMLFQNPSDQLFADSVEEEVAFGPRNFQRFDADQHEQILHEADLLHLRGSRPLILSVGQQQRTALSACLGLRPRLLILDEPTLGQDWGHLQRLMDFLQLLNQQGTAILLISHDYKLVHRYAQRVFLIENGRIRLDGQFDKTHTPKITPPVFDQQGMIYETINA